MQCEFQTRSWCWPCWPRPFSTGAMAETLRVALQDDPDSLDPATGGTYTGRIVFDALCDKLVDIDASLQVVPQLATEWSWNEDQTALTMKLREGVTFHDGTPFDAEAVKANIERMQTMGESRRKSELSPITSVEVVDPTTVVLHLEQPFAPLLSILTDRAGMMVSPAAATSADAFAANPACSGPFRVRVAPGPRQHQADEVRRLLERRRDLLRRRRVPHRSRRHRPAGAAAGRRSRSGRADGADRPRRDPRRRKRWSCTPRPASPSRTCSSTSAKAAASSPTRRTCVTRSNFPSTAT